MKILFIIGVGSIYKNIFLRMVFAIISEDDETITSLGKNLTVRV